MKQKFIKAGEFDQKFNNGKDLTEYFDLTLVKRPDLEQKHVNVDFPILMIQSLDKEAKRLGVTRQSIIKIWIADRLKTTS